MKLYLFLRSLIWTSILAVLFAVATIISAALDSMTLTLAFGLTAVTLAILSPRATR